MLKTGTIYGINGPVVYLKGNTGVPHGGRWFMSAARSWWERSLPSIKTGRQCRYMRRPQVSARAKRWWPAATLCQSPWRRGSSIIYLTVSRDRWSGLPIRRELLLPAVSAWIPWIVRRNGRRISRWKKDSISTVGISSRRCRRPGPSFHKCMVPPDLEGTVTDVVAGRRVYH